MGLFNSIMLSEWIESRAGSKNPKVAVPDAGIVTSMRRKDRSAGKRLRCMKSSTAADNLRHVTPKSDTDNLGWQILLGDNIKPIVTESGISSKNPNAGIP